MNKYQQMSLLDLLKKEKIELSKIEINQEIINNVLYDYKDADVSSYMENITKAIHSLDEIRSDIRQYFRHNSIVPLGGEF